MSPVGNDAKIDYSSEACVHAVTLRNTNRDAMTDKVSTMNSAFTARLTKITTDKAAADKKLASARTAAKSQFESKIQKLESQVGLTDVQIQAIETYKNDMEMAKTTRETAVDKARTDYRNALAETISVQQKALYSAVVTYQAAFEAAFATATSNCTNGTNMSAVKTAIQSAHQTLKSAVADNKTTDNIKALMTTRNDAIEAANDVFTKQAATFTQTLKTALSK
jgi:hypothetical protein